jgi:CheY-like chemotaxis protein
VASPEPVAAPLLLVVEDEASVRELVTRWLAYEGYSVLSAADGMTALAILQSLRGAVDLLVADIRMPRLNGDALALRAKEAGLVTACCS